MDQLRQKYTNWLINQNLNYALKFNGINQYASLGTMGNFGSNLGNGFYCKSDITIPSYQLYTYIFGTYGGNEGVGLTMYSPTALQFQIKDNNGLTLQGHFTANIFDGNKHTLEITAISSTNTIVANVDDSPSTVGYIAQQTPATFVNFQNQMNIGARRNGGNNQNPLACTLDNFQIGTSSSVLYGNYKMNEGSGTTIADSSGNGNTGTLVNDTSPSTMWVPGL